MKHVYQNHKLSQKREKRIVVGQQSGGLRYPSSKTENCGKLCQVVIKKALFARILSSRDYKANQKSDMV